MIKASKKKEWNISIFLVKLHTYDSAIMVIFQRKITHIGDFYYMLHESSSEIMIEFHIKGRLKPLSKADWRLKKRAQSKRFHSYEGCKLCRYDGKEQGNRNNTSEMAGFQNDEIPYQRKMIHITKTKFKKFTDLLFWTKIYRLTHLHILQFYLLIQNTYWQ